MILQASRPLHGVNFDSCGERNEYVALSELPAFDAQLL